MEKELYQSYINILKEELLPAMGCTEPISVAYAAALARDTLGAKPEKVDICVSGNILKNVKSVVVPNTGGMKGVSSAAAAGIVAGDADRKLEVISSVTPADKAAITEYLKNTVFTVSQSHSGCIFDITVTVYSGENSALVRIAGHHTNVVHVQKNGNDVLNCDISSDETPCRTDRNLLTVDKIIEFADCVEIDDIRETIELQLNYNRAIAEEGLKNDYGARVGKVLLSSFGSGVNNLAKATAAAGSDARMNGCSLPVVIVSGSGNQGMTASLPVAVYADYLKSAREELIRALAVSNLITIHLKTGIGRLSAYCGAVSAGCGAGAGICYLHGGKCAEVSCTVVNALAINSGLICDGAKSSCAAKIASSVEAGILGFEMSRKGSKFCGGDGILDDCVESTIDNVGDIARVGMRETDEEIIRLMIKKC
ncbi:MAG: L-serine ammonia-lyase, iron-sulfur-dependent, subunit alpha [Clostridia bacterium]|nr:L-serine ammonia-lyase, iron-sulfur-dependent, subunit alpha [Clostridia bacterium]